jgi:outer membrane protein OmpA-like peptidoglycan-associated protein
MAFNGSTSTSVLNVNTYTQGVGTLALSSSHGNYVMSFTNPVPHNYVINAATLTVTADNQVKTYGQNDPNPFTFQTSGLAGTDTVVGVLSGSLVRPTAGTLAGEQVGSYQIAQGTLTADNNYTLVFKPGTLTINPLLNTLTVTVNAGQGKVYGSNDPVLTFTTTGLVNGVVDGLLIQDTAANLFSGSLSRAQFGTLAGEQVGNYMIGEGSLSLTEGKNYGGTFAFTGGNFAIAPRPLTITANNQHKDPNTVFTLTGSEFSQSGLVDGTVDGVQLSDGISSVTLASAGSSAKATIGFYPISVSNPVGVGLSNYSISFQSGTMTVGIPCATLTQCAGPNIAPTQEALNTDLDIQFINPTAGNACNQLPIDQNQHPDDANQLLNDLNKNPCLRENLIAVLPEANGHVGAVVVHTNSGGTYLLNKAFAAVGSAAGSTDMRPISFDSSEVSSDFTTALQALPRIFTIYFGNGSTVILPRSQLDFTRALGDIKQRGAKQVVITGHTDTVGTEAYNDELSLRRAQSIEQMLIKGGISPTGVKIVGDGTRNPAVPTNGNVPQELNRRVVIDAQ